LLILVVLATVGAVYGVDRTMRSALSSQAAAQDDRTRADVLAVLEHRINDARALLADLASAHAVDCAASAAAIRAEAIAASAEVADIAVVDAGDKMLCSSLPVAFERRSADAAQPTTLGPAETIDTATYGLRGSPVLLLKHRLGGAGALVAIIPYANLVAAGGTAAGAPQLKLLYGQTVVYSSGVIEGPSAERPWIDRADAAYAPLGLSMPASDATIAWDHPARLTLNIATGAVVFSLGCLLLLRRRGARRLAATIDRAIRRNEFESLYRPIIDLESGRIAAMRLEVVWKVGRKRLSPDEYMADVRSVRLELKLLRSVLVRSRQSLAQAFKLRPRLLLKVIIDFETLQRPQFADVIRRAVAGSGIRLSQVVICVKPVTEANDAERVFGVLKTLQALGIGVELLESSGAVDFAFKAERLAAGSVALDPRLYAVIGASDGEDAARARMWVSQLVDAARTSATRICAYAVPDEVTLRALKSLGVREAEGETIVPPLTASTLIALVARAGIDWNDMPDADVPGGNAVEKMTA
jgi:EAL domain-containing protein (putative c-di-GMP-specific phosphodiesterase class I)